MTVLVNLVKEQHFIVGSQKSYSNDCDFKKYNIMCIGVCCGYIY